MKYYAPKAGNYESGLTAKLMYDVVDGLIRRHITREDIARLEQTPGLDLSKLWTKPEIRSELEEFLKSYFFSDLQVPLPGFEEIFTCDIKSQQENLESYMSKLEQHYGSRNEANRAITPLLNQLEKRGNRLFHETLKIKYLKKARQLIKSNAHDSFGHSVLYQRVQIAMSQLGIPLNF